MTIHTGLVLWWISKTHSEGRKLRMALQEVLDILLMSVDDPDNAAIDACKKALEEK
jgi:hypothetical protein